MSEKMTIQVATPGPYTILGNTIVDTYDVQDADLLNFSKDAQLRALCMGGAITLVVFNCTLVRDDAANWLMRVASGNIVYE